MNRVIFVCLALCLLIAPALCKPADNQSEKQIEDFEGETPIKNPDENEVNGTVNRNVERVGSPEIQKETDSGDDMEDDDKTDIATSSVNGQIQGVIELHGFNGEFHCRKIICPANTTRCEYNSQYSGKGNDLEVHYRCLNINGTVLDERTQTEKVEEGFARPNFDGFARPNFDGFSDISDMFKRMQEFMANMFRGPFWSDNDQ